MKTALVTGINGQDGSYLAEYLLERNYRVVGLCRRNSGMENLKGCKDKIEFCYGDLRDALSLNVAINKFRPDEIYNLAAQSFVPPSWIRPEDTIDVNVNGLLRILDIVEKVVPLCKVYQATSGEMYGNAEYGAKNENAECHPNSPYGVSKLTAHKLCSLYRQKGLFVVSGILFNHESPRRGIEMVTRKISKHVAEWIVGVHTEPIQLGNIDAKRDWGFAGDYVKVMHKMLQQKEADDFVIGTGEAHSVKEFLEIAVDVDHVLTKRFKDHIKVDPNLVRKSDNNCMLADYSKAERVMRWEPETSFESLVEMMVRNDVKLLEAQKVMQ